jgi:hypothetical protein
MSIVLTATKTVTTAATPQLTAAYLTTLMATPVEQLTIKQLQDLEAACATVSGGDNPATIGALLP